MRESWKLRGLGSEMLRTWETENGTWSWQQDYIYRGTQLAASETPEDDGPLHYHLDHLGSPRLITASTGAMKSRHVYFPFGPEHTPPGEEKLKFTGHERDQNGTLVGGADDFDYMHARYCLPDFGRFMSVDPILGGRERPQSWNRYIYALNNPLRLVDPTGLRVQVLTADALKLIRETVPLDLRDLIVLDKNNFLSLEKLNSAQAKNGNFNALRKLAASKGLVQVTTGGGLAGLSDVIEEEFFFETAEQAFERVVATSGSEVAESIKHMLGESSFLGYFLLPGESLSSHAMVVVSDGTGSAKGAPRSALVVTTAHELFGHALPFVSGKPFEHDSGGPVDVTISGIEERTRKLFP